MNKYQVEVRMSYFVWVDVEATDEHSARDQALRRAYREQQKGMGVWGEEPQVTVVIKGETAQEIEASGVLDIGGQHVPTCPAVDGFGCSCAEIEKKVEKLLEDYHPNEIGRLIGVSEQEGKKIVREIYFGWGYTEPDDWEVQELGDDHFILCLKQGDEWIDENGEHVLFESEEEALSHLRESLQLWHDEVARNTFS